MKTIKRLVCGMCGAFIPKWVTPDTAHEFACRCGPDTWFIVEAEHPVGRRRQKRLPGLPRVKRIKKGLDG